MTRRPIPGLDGYEADADGRIWKTTGRQRFAFEPHPLTPAVGAHGYLTVRVFVGSMGITKAVHPLVCRAFNGDKPQGHEACHVDGDKQNNRPTNLRWGTSKENAADRARHGRLIVPRGSRLDVTAAQVRALRGQGLSVNAIAKSLSVSWATVNKKLAT